MKLLLTSAGFSTNEIANKLVELVGKPKEQISFAVINEGYAVEDGDSRWVLDEMNTVSSTFGGMIQIVNLQALDIEQIEKRLMAVDAIYVVGGHTDYLMSVFDKSGLSTILPKILESKVYVGSSAGSMIIGKRISAEAYAKIYGETGTYGTTKYLELVNFAIKPHFNSPDWPNNREPVLRQVVTNFDSTLYALSDTSAIAINNNLIEIVGTEYLKI
jgi:dipeptidase E